MRLALFVVFILLSAPISGLVSADDRNQEELSSNTRELIIPTYSIAVQLAFERVSDLEQYSTEELEDTGQWLVISSSNKDEQMKMIKNLGYKFYDPKLFEEQFNINKKQANQFIESLQIKKNNSNKNQSYSF